MIRIELEKISFRDGSSFTAIDTAGYILQWVYRTNNAEKNYYVLPIPTIESHPYSYLADDLSMDAFRTFVADSRALFRKHNVNIEELKSAPEFHLQFHATDTLGVRKYLETHSGIRTINDVFYPTIKVGPFTLPDALHMQRRVKSDLPVEDLEIRKD